MKLKHLLDLCYPSEIYSRPVEKIHEDKNLVVRFLTTDDDGNEQYEEKVVTQISLDPDGTIKLYI